MSGLDDLVEEAARVLRRAIEADRAIDIAQIHFIGLDRIRAGAGGDWPKIKDRIRINSLRFLRDALGEEDLAIPCGDGFVVIFAGDCAGETLARRCLQLSEQLNAFYLGERWSESLAVEVEARTVAPGAVQDLLAGHAPPRPLAPSPSRVAASPEPALARLFSPRVGALVGALATAATPERGERRIGYGADPADDPPGGEALLGLELKILHLAADAAAAAIRSRPSITMFSVHAATLASRELRAAYLAALAEIPEPIRRVLIARVSGIEPHRPLLVLADWVGFLRGHVRRVALELDPHEKALASLSMSGAWAAGFVAPSRERISETIAHWGAALHRQELKFFVDAPGDARLDRLLAAERVEFSARF